MLLAGRNASPAPPDLPTFYLDECLPEVVAKALSIVGHPITSPREAGKLGVKDRVLIPWLASEHLVWVTKDDDAKRSHYQEIRAHDLSVVWVRGLDRSKRHISVKDLHLMLTVKLPQLIRVMRDAPSARYFELGLKSSRHGGAAVLYPVDQERLQPGRRLRRLGARR